MERISSIKRLNSTPWLMTSSTARFLTLAALCRGICNKGANKAAYGNQIGNTQIDGVATVIPAKAGTQQQEKNHQQSLTKDRAIADFALRSGAASRHDSIS